MKFIIKPFSEILVKSKPVRKRFLNYLQTNSNLSLKRIDESIKAKFNWDKWEVNAWEELTEFKKNELIKSLWRIPWIESYLEVAEYELWDFDDVFNKALELYSERLEWKSFAVRVKRSWNHEFRSIDLEKYVWGWLRQHVKDTSVKLKNPDITINIEIKDDKLYLVKKKYFWMWGYPVWTQDKVLSLISWGFDSGVSTYSMMKRWCKVDYLFFNLGWRAHELGVKQVSNYLWKNFSSGYKARFITVDFEEIVAYLLKSVNHRFRWIILKRLFLMVADKIAKENEYYAIVKWDSLGQVSSQTLKNMFVIDKASSTLVLRPLISFNKQEIVDITRKIGTYESACNMPEYCGVISDKPATWSREDQVLKEEENFDFSLLEKAFENKKVEKIDEVLENESEWEIEIEVSYIPWENEVVIDVREELKVKDEPLILDGVEVITMPFFDIGFDFEKLDQNKTYLLYCDKWILSKTHWLALKEKGFTNVKVYRPLLNDSACEIKTWK